MITNSQSIMNASKAWESPAPGSLCIFVSFCAYLLAQSFVIPVIAIGPSWALWPTFPDIAGLLMLLAWLITPKSRLNLPRTSSTVFWALVFLNAGFLFHIFS